MPEDPLKAERYLPNEAGPVQPRPVTSVAAKIKPRTRVMPLSYTVSSQRASPPLGLLDEGGQPEAGQPGLGWQRRSPH